MPIKHPKPSAKTMALIRKQSKKGGGVRIDMGCGHSKQEGFIGVDIRKTESADIVFDVTKTPYPLPNECADIILASHLVEHIQPHLFMAVMDEWWRISKDGGQLWIACPYAGSPGFWQDPTHCNGFTEATWTYWDPRQFLYEIYRPKPWLIQKNVWNFGGNCEVVLTKCSEKEGEKIYKVNRAEREKQGVGYGVSK